MLATISPSSTVIDETINTLRYAGLASTITNVPRIKTPHLRHEIDELREENARLKQELFLVKSKSMPSIHSAIATISKTSLASVDECLQTSFAIDSSSSPVHEEESASEEKLDMVDQEVTRVQASPVRLTLSLAADSRSHRKPMPSAQAKASLGTTAA